MWVRQDWLAYGTVYGIHNWDRLGRIDTPRQRGQTRETQMRSATARFELSRAVRKGEVVDCFSGRYVRKKDRGLSRRNEIQRGLIFSANHIDIAWNGDCITEVSAPMDAQFVTFDLSKLFAELISDRQFESYLNFHNAMQSFTKTSGCVYKHGRTAYMKADSVRRSTLMYRHFTLRCAVTDCPSCFKVSAKGYYLRVIRSNMLHKHPVQTSKEQPQPIVADHTEVFQEHFQGRSFDSFESLQEAVKNFENVTGSRFVIRLCRLLKEDHELAGTVRYRSVTLGCTHGYTYELKPQQRTFTETRHSGCKARINVNLKQGRLLVTSACQEHNHLTSPAAVNRDLTARDARAYLELASAVKPSNYYLARELGVLYGAKSSYRRVRRMRAYAHQRKRANRQLEERERDKSDNVLREPFQLKNRVFRTEETDQTTCYESLDKWHTEERSPDATTDVHALDLGEDTSKPLLPSEVCERLLCHDSASCGSRDQVRAGTWFHVVVEAASGRVFHRPTGRLIAPLIETSSQEATERDLQEAEPADPLVGSHLPRPACTTTRTQSLSPISSVVTRSDGTCFKVNRTVDDITPDTPTVVL
nr:unnamed protein product [Spirometra erinaceieuropaei]